MGQDSGSGHPDFYWYSIGKSMKQLIIVEDHPDFRTLLTDLVGFSEEFTVAGAFGSVEELASVKSRPDLVLMDIGLPGQSGLEGLKLVKSQFPSTRVVMLTNLSDDDLIYTAITEGADGYLLKSTAPEGILSAIRETLTGGASLTPSIARRVIETFSLRKKQPEPGAGLSGRETEVLQLLVRGMNHKRIAEQLFISPETVRNHIKAIYEKLQVHTRSEVVARALKERMV